MATINTSTLRFVTNVPAALFKAIVITPHVFTIPGVNMRHCSMRRDSLSVSIDGTNFTAVAFTECYYEHDTGSFIGTITSPALDINNASVEYNAATRVLSFSDVIYRLESVTNIAIRPIMQINELYDVEGLGIYLTARNMLAMGSSYAYFNGEPLVNVSGVSFDNPNPTSLVPIYRNRSRTTTVSHYLERTGTVHEYRVEVNEGNPKTRVVTFDGKPAKRVYRPTEKYAIVFADDASSVKITKEEE